MGKEKSVNLAEMGRAGQSRAGQSRAHCRCMELYEVRTQLAHKDCQTVRPKPCSFYFRGKEVDGTLELGKKKRSNGSREAL